MGLLRQLGDCIFAELAIAEEQDGKAGLLGASRIARGFAPFAEHAPVGGIAVDMYGTYRQLRASSIRDRESLQ
jgi:hypothetical protein